MTKRIQWILSVLALLIGGVFVYAQNPVSIAQIGTTAVTTTLPISGSLTNISGTISLPTGAATETTLGTRLSESDFDTKTGSLTEAAPASDTASSGLNGRLQRVAQRITSLITALGSPFQAGGSIGNTTFAATQGTAANLNATVVGTGTFSTQVTSVPADPFGANADAASATGSMSAKLRFIAATGIPITGTVTVGSHAVTNAGTFAVQPTANAQVDVNKWNGQALASPDANSYALISAAATATTTAGTSTCYFPSAASNNAQFCKASAGNLYEVHVSNTTTTNYFLRLYNLTAAPTCSSATGFVETIPAFGAAANGGVNGRLMNPPQAFTTGIAFCLTGGSSSTDNTNAATGVTITLLYK